MIAFVDDDALDTNTVTVVMLYSGTIGTVEGVRFIESRSHAEAIVTIEPPMLLDRTETRRWFTDRSRAPAIPTTPAIPFRLHRYQVRFTRLEHRRRKRRMHLTRRPR